MTSDPVNPRKSDRKPAREPSPELAAAAATVAGAKANVPRDRESTFEPRIVTCLYLVTRSLDPTGTGRARSTMRWKPVR